jgi:starch phosphorylase
MDLKGFDSLAELALDMRWSWNHATDKIWRLLDPRLWDLTQNPWVVLQTVARDQLEKMLSDSAFRKNVDDLLQAKHEEAKASTWFQQQHANSPLTCVAYFCMEFMLSEALPIYSGGLGNVAGDQLKTASDHE